MKSDKELRTAIEVATKEINILNGYMQVQDMWIHRERFLSMILALNTFLSLANSYLAGELYATEDEIENIIEDNKLYQGFQCEDYIIRVGLKKQLARSLVGHIPKLTEVPKMTREELIKIIQNSGELCDICSDERLDIVNNLADALLAEIQKEER